ncbi:MAG: hypothetical protein V3R29_01115 [Candidatus Acidoferrales bacterium]
MAQCPDCGALLDIDKDDVEEGETLSCPECAVELEVVNRNPLELDVIEEEEEDEPAKSEEKEEDNGEDEDDY